MGCKYRIMDKCYAKDNIKDAFCFGKDGCPYYKKKVETIPQSDYETRLKADLETILVDLQLEIEKNGIVDFEENYVDNGECIISVSECNRLIQQKIDKLKGAEE